MPASIRGPPSMFELYRYENPTLWRSKHSMDWPNVVIAKLMAEASERLEPGRAFVFEIVDKDTGKIVWRGYPGVGWRRMGETKISEPWPK